MAWDHQTYRRFAGFTPINVVDRVREAETSRLAKARWSPPARFCSYYGPQRDLELFIAMSAFRGRAYRAGDAGRRTRR